MTTESHGVLILATWSREARGRHDTLPRRWPAGRRPRIHEESQVPAQPGGRERSRLDGGLGARPGLEGPAREDGAEPGSARAPAWPSRLERRRDQPEHLGRL